MATIINDDVLTALGKMKSGSYNLIMSSPPYNIGKSYEKRVSMDDYAAWMEQVATELIRVLRDDGAICWQVGNYIENGEVFPLDHLFYKIFCQQFGLKLRKRIIWSFGHGLHCTRRFSGRHETILYMTKSDQYTYCCDPLAPADIREVVERDWDNEIWEIVNVKSNHPEKGASHPCQFPVEMVERCLLMLTKPGDAVLDPFCGVGSTLIACERWNRIGTGIDKEKSHCIEAADRIKKLHAGTLKTRPMTKKIHEPKPAKNIA